MLIVGPFTIWWRRNFFAEILPWLPVLMASPFVRVGVALWGLVTVLVGIGEVWSLLFRGIGGRRSPGDSGPS